MIFGLQDMGKRKHPLLPVFNLHPSALIACGMISGSGVVIRFENTPTVLPLAIAPGVSQTAETDLEPVIFE